MGKLRAREHPLQCYTYYALCNGFFLTSIECLEQFEEEYVLDWSTESNGNDKS